MAHSIRKVGVIGAGQMGSGIAHVCALSDFDVKLYDVSEDRIKQALATINGNMARQVSKKTITEDQRQAALKRIHGAASMTDFSDADLVIESAVEKEDVKRKIYTELCPSLKPDAILATNTSSLSITRLASATDRPERFIGIHFMNPVPLMELVELIRGIATDDATFEASKVFVTRLGKQIALLDPNNTEVCLSLADSYLREGQWEESVDAYAEAAARFSRQNRHEEALRALSKGFEISGTDLRILNGLVKTYCSLGRAPKAVSLLEEILENDPYNRDVLYLLIECCIDTQNAVGAEKAVIKLVEIEPANYPKFLDLVRIYLNGNDPVSAARILTMSSEYLLAGGQSEDCLNWVNEVLVRDPNQLAGLRLLVRYNSWANDPDGFCRSLERLYNAAAEQCVVEDERFALAQLVVIKPHETRFHERLAAINVEFGYEDNTVDEELLKAQFEVLRADDLREHAPEGIDAPADDRLAASIADHKHEDAHVVNAAVVDAPVLDAAPQLSLADEQRIQKELESITFYCENGYDDLAEKALAQLRAEFGDLPEFRREEPVVEFNGYISASTLNIADLRSEFGLEGAEPEHDNGDYDTHFQMATAYKEMGLMEDSIREYQEAISLTEPGDGTRRFFYCANLLGHCFLESGKPHHAVTWINRALDTPVSVEEQHGLWYELALALEATGDSDSASGYFEKIYAEDVDFRDVRDRVKSAVSMT